MIRNIFITFIICIGLLFFYGINKQNTENIDEQYVHDYRESEDIFHQNIPNNSFIPISKPAYFGLFSFFFKIPFLFVDIKREDFQEWINQPLDDLKEQLFSKKETLEEKGLSRPGINKIAANKCPVVVSYKVLSEKQLLNFNINIETCLKNLNYLQNNPEISDKISKIFLSMILIKEMIEKSFLYKLKPSFFVFLIYYI